MGLKDGRGGASEIQTGGGGGVWKRELISLCVHQTAQNAHILIHVETKYSSADTRGRCSGTKCINL